jgi:hypothetical protein
MALLQWKTGRREVAGNYSAFVTTLIKNGYEYDAGNSATYVDFIIQ